MVDKIPQGFHTITPTLIVEGARDAIALYKKAFGATEDYVMPWPSSDKVMHASLNIGNSKLFLSDPMPNCGAASPGNFYLYVEDVDAAFEKAKSAGLQETMKVEDMFWGDRIGALKDAFGNSWTVATHVRDVSDEEMKKAAEQMSKSQAA